MGDPCVRNLGYVADIDGLRLLVGVNYDAVTLGFIGEAQWSLTRDQAEEFAHLFVASCWEAGENARHMADETPSTPLDGASRKIGREWCRVKPGLQGRLVSFGGVNDDAFAWVEVRPEAAQHPEGGGDG